MALVTTTKGDVDDSLLLRREYDETTAHGVAHITEYLLDGEVIHRSVHFVFHDGEPLEVFAELGELV
jgi:hypothetical protein